MRYIGNIHSTLSIYKEVITIGIVIVEICDNNVLDTSYVEQVLESEYPEVDVIDNECLNFCGMCKHTPYAMVNGKRIFAKTTEECLSKIRERIHLELAAFV